MEDHIWHIIPINDLEEHLQNFDGICKCKPTTYIAESGTIIVVHNSFDKRENVEKLRFVEPN